MTMGSVVRIAQISDTHLSRTHAYFVDNWGVLVDELTASPPDLIVHSGDVSFNGPVTEDDLIYARAEMDRLPARWRAIPGNHDIGEAPRFSRLNQPLTDERIASWRRHFGPTWWSEDVGAWRLVGIDTSLLGSERPDEQEQTAFLRDALASRGDRPVLVFMHMPPFVMTADEETSTSSVPSQPRNDLLELCSAGGVRVIVCGHLHVYRQMRCGDIDIVWAPCTSFVTIQRWHSRIAAFPRSGYVEWALAGREISHRLIEPPLMISHDMGLWSSKHGTTTKLPPRGLIG